MTKLRSPIFWFGGKGNMTAKLLTLMPTHREYVEAFGGGGSLLLAKIPAKVETYNDLNSDLVNLFRVLRDPVKFEQFHYKASLTPYSREEYYFCRETFRDCQDDVERAYRWFIVARMSFGGHFGNSWGFSVLESNRGMTSVCSNFLSIIEMLPQIHKRLMTVQIEHSSWQKILEIYNPPTTLIYLDPPYIPETRSGGEYKHEMTADDHRELVEKMLEYPGMIMLSGYDHEIYKPLIDNGWDVKRFNTACHSAGKTRHTKIQGKGSATAKQPRIECVFRNPKAMAHSQAKIF